MSIRGDFDAAHKQTQGRRPRPQRRSICLQVCTGVARDCRRSIFHGIRRQTLCAPSRVKRNNSLAAKRRPGGAPIAPLRLRKRPPTGHELQLARQHSQKDALRPGRMTTMNSAMNLAGNRKTTPRRGKESCASGLQPSPSQQVFHQRWRALSGMAITNSGTYRCSQTTI